MVEIVTGPIIDERTEPCPFCSDTRPAHVVPHLPDKDDPDGRAWYFCECECCGAEGPPANSEEGARKVWNCRYSGDKRHNATSAHWRLDFKKETS